MSGENNCFQITSVIRAESFPHLKCIFSVVQLMRLFNKLEKRRTVSDLVSFEGLERDGHRETRIGIRRRSSGPWITGRKSRTDGLSRWRVERRKDLEKELCSGSRVLKCTNHECQELFDDCWAADKRSAFYPGSLELNSLSCLRKQEGELIDQNTYQHCPTSCPSWSLSRSVLRFFITAKNCFSMDEQA